VYPNLTPTLVVLLGAGAAIAMYIALRRPFLRRLALRQVSRRRTEATLVVAGSVLGTAIIVGSLIVGDTLNFSVRQSAYKNLGPIDEIVASSSIAQGDQVAQRLQALREDPLVDGMLTVRADLAAVTKGTGASRRAEPRATVWGVDFDEAAAFGGTDSGLTGPAPAFGETVLNEDLAAVLGAVPGDTLTFYLYGLPVDFRVARVVPTRGVAGAGTGAVTRNAFVSPGTLVVAAGMSGTQPQTLTFVSNTGGTEDGARYSDTVTTKIRTLLGPMARQGTSVEKVKQDVLDRAKIVGDSLGSLFLFIGSFAIIAGLLLLVNIFVMLAEERKPELGMLRAIGMKRSRLVRSFVIEGTIYALLSSLVGILVGIGVGRAVVIVAARIFNSSAPEEGGLILSFKVTSVTIMNGFAMGFLMSFVTVALTSMRISRVNIIAAIRDLPPAAGRRMRRRWVIVAAAAAVMFAALFAQAIAANAALGTYLYPSLAVLAACPLLLRLFPQRWVNAGAPLAVLAWALLANRFRPHILDEASSGAYIVQGVLLTFSAVFLLSQNQRILTRPFRRLLDRPTPGGLASRLAVAYPVTRRFRTGAILVMYSLVMFTLVLITVLGAMVSASVDSEIANASGGFEIRADFNPASPLPDPVHSLTSGPFAGRIDAVVPYVVARGKVTNLGNITVDTMVVGTYPDIAEAGLYPLSGRMARFATDQEAWKAVFSDTRLVIVDQYMGQVGGGPPKVSFAPGDTLTLVDPATGKGLQKTIAGMLKSAWGFYGIANTEFISPVIMSDGAARMQFSDRARLAGALLRLSPGVSADAVARDLQAQQLGHGMVATRIRRAVEQSMAANRGFFQLMQGFLALGLLVGIAGLGVVMVRAVRERRRTIGVLRALGFPASTVLRGFLFESCFIAAEGLLLGSGLAVVTSYLLFTNYPSFQGLGIGFPVPWASIGVLLAAAAVASILATLGPARKASRIEPAVALRITD
jgi:putative ABC transport system permease protein